MAMGFYVTAGLIALGCVLVTLLVDWIWGEG
jgi:hypothetical protein